MLVNDAASCTVIQSKRANHVHIHVVYKLSSHVLVVSYAQCDTVCYAVCVCYAQCSAVCVVRTVCAMCILCVGHKEKPCYRAIV